MPKAGKTQGNQSGEKLLTLLETLVLSDGPVRLMDISEELGMNISTTLRYMTTLISKGYAEQDPETQKYSSTYKICALAAHVNKYQDIRRIARPYLEQLVKIFGESVNMAVENNMHSVYVEVIRDTSSSLMAVQTVGNSVPMHCTGNGKLLLLNYSDEELDHLIRVVGLTRFTENTITSKEELRKELDRIRARGYAYDEEERELGMRCLAFPVYDATGRVAAGVSVTGPKTRMTDAVLDPHLEDFRRITEEISRKIGYHAFVEPGEEGE